jgi:hypothetical protein
LNATSAYQQGKPAIKARFGLRLPPQQIPRNKHDPNGFADETPPVQTSPLLGLFSAPKKLQLLNFAAGNSILDRVYFAVTKIVLGEAHL